MQDRVFLGREGRCGTVCFRFVRAGQDCPGQHEPVALRQDEQDEQDEQDRSLAHRRCSAAEPGDTKRPVRSMSGRGLVCPAGAGLGLCR